MPITPELLRRLAALSEENAARELLKSYALARIYPNGIVPSWGVTMCREWLRDRYDEGSLEFRLLNLVEVHDDDQGWSLNGVPQGGVWDLVTWIVGEMTPEDAGWVRTDMSVDYDMLVSDAKYAVERQHKMKSYSPSSSTP